MTVLVTGAAGFIGYHTIRALLGRGERVVGVDSLNAYYPVALKQARLAELDHPQFRFEALDIADRPGVDALFSRHGGIDRVVHLAAQAGVRYSLVDPDAYVRSNLMGQLAILEACRHRAGLRHLVYASSSSVYGGNEAQPFSIADRTDKPLSLYGATKKSGELMAYSYAHLFRLPATGLRFFTVYGPWGRPDMAPWLFTDAILAGRPIALFNNGDMARDFTFVDDVVAGVLAALDRPPADDGQPPHRVYNLGNRRAERLADFIATIEAACGRQAIIEPKPMQPGDVRETLADIEASAHDLGYRPTTPISVGVPRFVEWFRSYTGR